MSISPNLAAGGPPPRLVPGLIARVRVICALGRRCALIAAAERGHVEVVHRLLEQRADVSTTNANGS